jgi:mannose-1-phosphate guanylyltransferase
MVLAAGLGTRLRPLSDARAKALVPIGDRPALAHVLAHLRSFGVTRIAVNAHHRVEEVRSFVLAQPEPTVSLSEEVELLGTAGGLARAGEMLGDGDVLVWNGDILASVDIGALTAAHVSGGWDATLVVQPLAPGEGRVGLDAAGRVVRLRSEGIAPEARGGEFLGVHVIGSALRRRLPERGGLIEDLYLPALRRGAAVRAFLYDAAWFDIGTVATYLEANFAWLARRGLGSYVGGGAHIAPSVVLDRCVIGSGARVEGTGVLERCVVWPGARAMAPQRGNAIIS